MTVIACPKIADCDSHVTESPDLWLSRVPSKFIDSVPRVDPHPVTGVRRWHIDEIWMFPLTSTSTVGWHEDPPKYPDEWEQLDPGSYDPVARLARLDELGIDAQTLYPNVIAFATGVFMGMEREVSLACVRAYNDFLTEFAAADPNRLLPIAMVPFWDVEASVKEIERVAALGHRGILFANKFEKLGLPRFQTAHWDPIYDAAQALDLSMNFHAGFGNSPMPKDKVADVDPFGKWKGDIGDLSASVAIAMIQSNAQAIGTITTCGVAERFPRLRFVSVESGVGYLPFLLESLDWHFKGYGVGEATGRRLPSDIFREQCYGAFWFETCTLGLLEQYPDNFLFSTDYPHPTSLIAGPASPSLDPKEHITAYFDGVPEDVTRKALWDNAARLYKLDA
jgi:uncharacterized protein